MDNKAIPCKTYTCPPHPYILLNNCLVCDKSLSSEELDSDAASTGPLLPFNYLGPGITIRANIIEPLRLAITAGLLKRKKLVLVLDLDHTLLHTTTRPVPPDQSGNQHYVYTKGYTTKIRPFAREFLSAVSKKFEIYVYTMGKRHYANEMVRFLDAERKYIGDRNVIAYEDCRVTRTKSLDIVIADPKAIVILDDTVDVWDEKDRGNLIAVERYEVPQSCGEDNDRVLTHMRRDLENLHNKFFKMKGEKRDVREVMKRIREDQTLLRPRSLSPLEMWCQVFCFQFRNMFTGCI